MKLVFLNKKFKFISILYLFIICKIVYVVKLYLKKEYNIFGFVIIKKF